MVAFVRSYEDEHILVVANCRASFSTSSSTSNQGDLPVELFGRGSFPPSGRPYTLSRWARTSSTGSRSAPPPGAGSYAAPSSALPKIEIVGEWESLLKGDQRASLERVLPGLPLSLSLVLEQGARPRRARIVDDHPSHEDCNPCITIVEVEFTEGEPERYVLPLGFVADAAAHELRERAPEQVIADVSLVGESGASAGSFATWPPIRVRPALARCHRATTPHQG